MAIPALSVAPVLSTPDTHIFEDPTPAVDTSNIPRLSDEQVALTYEIERTVKEIREGRWKRIALQFPDHMLTDAPRVYDKLTRGLKEDEEEKEREKEKGKEKNAEEKLFILGDSSYGACCVDEVAAEHVDADVVVHYGRSCLSPPPDYPSYTSSPHNPSPRPCHLNIPTNLPRQISKSNPNGRPTLHPPHPTPPHPSPRHRLHKPPPNHHPPQPHLPNPQPYNPPETTHSPDTLRTYSLFHISDPHNPSS
ncbi:hypothetical protein GQ44DRAFT_822862 [Phaeosphaeriaceae sp. PMI808]|nr:hypothetical protein GQ44DRAFT_822862 [Phaeosphaeriaceae sp. PMI808]